MMNKKMIAALAVIAIVLVVAAAMIMTNQDKQLTPVPFQAGARVGETTGWDVELTRKEFTTGREQVAFTVRDASGSPLPGPLVTLTLQSAKKNGFRRTYGAYGTGTGIYRTEVTFPSSGRWDISVYVFLNGESLTHTERVNVRDLEK